jgi:hypothetical protein
MPRLLTAATLVIGAVVVLGAQVPQGSPPVAADLRYGQLPPEPASFTFCRLMYRSVRTEPLGSGWTTDYPSADQNLMIRISELTYTDVSRGMFDEPLHAVMRATDKEVFRCPFLFASDAGTLGFLDAEVISLRDYLLKGGFLWVDDFWGDKALRQFTSEIRKVLPNQDVVELLPRQHPIFSTFFDIEELPQVPALSFWVMTNGLTAEQGGTNPGPAMYGIFDDNDRLMVLMTHNTDIADGWEREIENVEYFHTFAPSSYAIGANVVIWAMTH